MPLRRNILRVHHRKLFGARLEKITLLKRDDDQRQGTVTAHVLYQCYHSMITKGGQTLDGDMTTDHTITWHIPRVELDRVGINYLNPLDIIVDKFDRYWQPEAPNTIDIKLIETRLDINCKRLKNHG